MLNVTIMNKINGFAGPAMQTGANAMPVCRCSPC